jgi:hypothetical protein
VARYGDDRSVIFKRQGLASWTPIVLRQFDTMTLSGVISREIEEWRPSILP